MYTATIGRDVAMIESTGAIEGHLQCLDATRRVVQTSWVESRLGCISVRLSRAQTAHPLHGPCITLGPPNHQNWKK